MNMDENTESLLVRLIKVELDSGEIEVLATNLFDKITFPVKEFKDLYIMRWQVEEAYKLLKLRLDLDSFQAKPQDPLGKTFMRKFL